MNVNHFTCGLFSSELETPPWDLADKLGITNSEPTRGQIKSHTHQLYCSFDHSRQIYSIKMTPRFILANLPTANQTFQLVPMSEDLFQDETR